jgi:hypothetical protein
MKLIVVCASLDLTQPFSATPAWWQLLKALYEIGVDVIASPYQGPAIESLWWRAAANPAKWQGDAFKLLRDTLRKIGRSDQQSAIPAVASHSSQQKVEIAADNETVVDRAIRGTVKALITPLWLRHLDRLLAKNPDTDAVLVLTAPLNHLIGVGFPNISGCRPGGIHRVHQQQQGWRGGAEGIGGAGGAYRVLRR